MLHPALSAVDQPERQPCANSIRAGLLLGTVYSVPPFRLKRYAITAFLIIATVRGFLLNFGVFTATRAALGLPFVWSPAVLCVPSHLAGFCRAAQELCELNDASSQHCYCMRHPGAVTAGGFSYWSELCKARCLSHATAGHAPAACTLASAGTCKLTAGYSCRFITGFVTLFATAIAITKDLTDVEGDLQYKIDTFATRFGTRTVARLGECSCATACKSFADTGEALSSARQTQAQC